jgi:hypothetical protein
MSKIQRKWHFMGFCGMLIQNYNLHIENKYKTKYKFELAVSQPTPIIYISTAVPAVDFKKLHRVGALNHGYGPPARM